MKDTVATRVEEFFKDRTAGNLRSIITYEKNEFDIVFVRDDVSEQYTPDDVEIAVDHARMESLTAPIYDGVYSVDHGELDCMVKCFERVIEMNFVLSDGVGAAVALDEAAMAEARGLVAEAREIIVEERRKTSA